MPLTNKEIKQRYFRRVYRRAEWVKCACGCGKLVKDKDRYGRDKRYINGHNGRKYEDPTQYKREWNHRNRKKRYVYKTNYQKKKKVELIKIFGGKCSKCGLKHNGENGSLFQFHHEKSKNKKFPLTLRYMGQKWEDILKESKKCMLVCSNCHFLIHSDKY